MIRFSSESVVDGAVLRTTVGTGDITASSGALQVRYSLYSVESYSRQTTVDSFSSSYHFIRWQTYVEKTSQILHYGVVTATVMKICTACRQSDDLKRHSVQCPCTSSSSVADVLKNAAFESV